MTADPTDPTALGEVTPRLHHRQAEKRSRFQGTNAHGARIRTGLLAQLPEVSVLYATGKAITSPREPSARSPFRFQRSNCGLRHAGESIWDCGLCVGNGGYSQTNARNRSRLAPSIIGTVLEVSRHMRTFSYADVSLDAPPPKRHHDFCERQDFAGEQQLCCSEPPLTPLQPPVGERAFRPRQGALLSAPLGADPPHLCGFHFAGAHPSATMFGSKLET